MVVVANKTSPVSGTSAACPALAGLFSNINAARIAKGKGSVGFINLALYTYASSFVNDIIEGDNKCAITNSGTKSCKQGFSATPGWDPASGLGSVNYMKLEATFLSLGTIRDLTDSPTSFPTSKVMPTKTMRPTRRPRNSNKPRANPFLTPSSSPSALPSDVPTVMPSNRPTSQPSNIQTVNPSYTGNADFIDYPVSWSPTFSPTTSQPTNTDP